MWRDNVAARNRERRGSRLSSLTCRPSDSASPLLLALVQAMGPSGAKTLCNACGSRYRAGHTSMPEKNAEGQFLCSNCTRTFSTIGALGGHRRFCDSGSWRCSWCSCKHSECSGKVGGAIRRGRGVQQSLGAQQRFVSRVRCQIAHSQRLVRPPSQGPGPTGPKTLCSACSSRYKTGRTGPPEVNSEGKFVCEACSRIFESIGALGGHKRFCDSGAWRCNWCRCKYAECSGKVRAAALPRTSR